LWQFFVGVLADPQVGWNKDDYNSLDLLRQAAELLVSLQPDLLLVAGDMMI